ncbi:hypothetical protein [Stenotrophomonas maltophilia]|uniref:hypothetical protein n=1 Tax=Stenotrophomonas maltophilia TaxID=40324 RepID=UPI0012DAFFC7|nr:hypothetical protein [Stenotrophomonas maltophilia]
MEAKVIIAIGAAYAGIYYLAARRLLFQLRDIDQDYFKYLGARGGVGSSNSSAVIALVLDGDAPKEFSACEHQASTFCSASHAGAVSDCSNCHFLVALNH